MTEHDALVSLNAVPGLGSLKIKRLLEAFGSAQAVWKEKRKALCTVDGIGGLTAKNILDFNCDAFLEEEYRLAEKHQARIITFFDDYPQHLKQIPDCPAVLYVCGQWPQTPLPGIAIVGSRQASVYGLSVARSFAQSCAQWNITVVSGMARGIDTAAHAGCLEAGGKTAAVLGNGLASIYPRENERLFQDIIQNGCVISEFPMQAGPVAGNFPRRNRIISGLSYGVIVVEAALKSGALITSRYALEQGREVFAVPGKIGQAQAAGTNRLIQQGAKLITCMEDVLEEFPAVGGKAPAEEGVTSPQDSGLTEQEQALFKLLSDEPVYIDDIMEKMPFGHQHVLTMLLHWECRGRIRRLPGNYFVNIQHR